MKLLILLTLLLITSCSSFKYTNTSICPNEVNLDRIKEFTKLSSVVGPKLWNGWNEYEQSILFVDEEYEFLFGHKKIPKEFKKACYVKSIGRLWYRKRFFDKRMEASFPVFSMVPTIVIGSVENTNSKTSTEWLSILLHERFHQIQYSQPNYYKYVNDIKPSSARDGSWMLNYQFPYSDKKLLALFKKLGRSLLKAVDSKNESDYLEYKKIKGSISKRLKRDDLNYMNFQIWQEGIARYVEIQSLKKMSEEYFSDEFKKLKDFELPQSVLSRKLKRIREKLSHLDLGKQKRGAFYALGLYEGLALDIFKSEWKERYLKSELILEL
jgi:hypothetical protein